MLFEIQQLTIRGLNIPNFSLSHGDNLVMHWPYALGGSEELSLYRILTRKRKSKKALIYERAAIASPHDSALCCLTLLELKKKNSDIFDYLIKNHCIDISDIDKELIKLPFTVRVLSAIALASLSSKAIIFNTAGLDPLGINITIQYINMLQLEGWGILEIKFPVHHEPTTPLQRVEIYSRKKINGFVP